MELKDPCAEAGRSLGRMAVKNRSAKAIGGIAVAERGGFEPPIRFYSYNGLANRRFRPLSHLSIRSDRGSIFLQIPVGSSRNSRNPNQPANTNRIRHQRLVSW